MSCACANVPMGSYANQARVVTPWGDAVGIDRCILAEIRVLWAADIRTIESCCGHGTAPGYIAVTPECEGAMEALGYQRAPGAPHVFALQRNGVGTER